MLLIYFVVTLSMTFVGCASHDIRQIAPDPIGAYQIQANESGVVVAADPFSTKEKAESAFTLDLTEQGFVPVLLVLENRTKDNVLLIKDDIELTDSRGNIRKPVSANIMVSKFEHNKMAYALLGFGIFPTCRRKMPIRRCWRTGAVKNYQRKKFCFPVGKHMGLPTFI